jgi:transposase-like protein
MANRRRDAGRERLWRSRLKRQAASRLSVRAFCRREGVAEPSFYAWRRTIAERDASRRASRPPASEPPPFVSVAVTGQPIGTASIVIELAGGRVLRLPESISAGRLAELVHALESRGPA